jgi:hypothetical protein
MKNGNSILLLLTTIVAASSSSTPVARIVVTLHQYNACDVASQPAVSNSCASMAKCYGRRLVLGVENCTPENKNLDSISLWLYANILSKDAVADIEVDEMFSASSSDSELFLQGSLAGYNSIVDGTGTSDHAVNRSSTQQEQPSQSPQQWNLDTIDAYRLWQNLSSYGEQRTVAVLDSGTSFNALAAFSDSRVISCYDFVSDESISKDCDRRDADFYDPCNADEEACPGEGSSWHGTRVASVLAANYSRFLGVAPWAHIVPVRVLGRCKAGFASDVADAIVWASGGEISGLQTVAEAHIQAIVMSFAGLGTCPSCMQTAVDMAVSRNVTLYAAAGNDPCLRATDSFPANCRGVVSVGGLSYSGTPLAYSATRAQLYMLGRLQDHPVPCLGGGHAT